jgi:hypothetical protein
MAEISSEQRTSATTNVSQMAPSKGDRASSSCVLMPINQHNKPVSAQ